ncbi:uncharacterized protein LOC144663518 [Oculina patagonica]
MLSEEAGHVEVHMASHRFCLRLCFLGLITLSLCSVVFIMTRGYLSFYIHPGFEIVDEVNNLLEQKRELQNNYIRRGNYSERACKQDKFDNILLVIAFVEFLYDSIPYLEQLYRNRFPNIVYCGPAKPSKESEYKIIVVSMLRGVTAYECLSTAMRTQPQFTGYLFIRNDLFLNFWNIAIFNRSRIWESSEQLGKQVMFQQPRESWIWWYTPWGLKACEEAYKELIYLNDAYKRAIIDSKGQHESSWDVENSLNALLWNGRGLNMCYRGFSNVFYIPSEHAVAFEKLSAVFQKHQVYMEIAVPTIIKMLDLSEKSVQLTGVDVGSLYGEERAQKDDSLFWRHFSPNTSYIRPIVLTRNYTVNSKTSGVVDVLLKWLNHIDCAEGLS